MKLVAAIVALLLPCTAALAFDPFAAASIDKKPGAVVPLDGGFLDAGGAPVTLSGIGGGKPILLVPVLHDCPNICGVTLAGIAQAAEVAPYQPGRDYALVAFGIDPREGPAESAKSLIDLGRAFPSLVRSGGISAVTGPAAQIARVTDALGYHYAFDERISQYAHIAASAVLTADGRLVRWLYGVAPSPTDLKLALTEAGEGRIGSWSDQLLLLCYHYDPVTGRYGSLIWTVLRAGGGGTAALLLGFLGLSFWRERRGRTAAQGRRPLRT